MRERPIILNSEMVKAILDGKKTQTRKLIKFKNPREDCVWCYGKGFEYIDCGNELSGYDYRRPCRCCWSKDPYEVGDRLWVRETWMLFGLSCKNAAFIHYKASENKNAGERLLQYQSNKPLFPSLRWRPSIHMPRWVSRITLEITDVRVERLQEISEEDVISEGIPNHPGQFREGNMEAFVRFAYVWNSLYTKKPDYQWEANPWIWVTEFRTVSVNLK